MPLLHVVLECWGEAWVDVFTSCSLGMLLRGMVDASTSCCLRMLEWWMPLLYVVFKCWDGEYRMPLLHVVLECCDKA